MEDTMMMMMMSKRKESNPCSSSGLGINKESQTISKVKPKIRIIHISAPEVIKTDVQNFRELVQRLTGKPSPADQHHHHRPIKRLSKQRNQQQQKQQESSNSDDINKKKKAEEMVQIKEEEEEEMWNNSGGFLSDFDGFFQQLDHFSPNDHFHPFSDTQLASL